MAPGCNKGCLLPRTGIILVWNSSTTVNVNLPSYVAMSAAPTMQSPQFVCWLPWSALERSHLVGKRGPAHTTRPESFAWPASRRLSLLWLNFLPVWTSGFLNQDCSWIQPDIHLRTIATKPSGTSGVEASVHVVWGVSLVISLSLSWQSTKLIPMYWPLEAR
jgi:hypothetical protein